MFADIATEASKGSQMDTKDMRHQTALSVLNPHASLNNMSLLQCCLPEQYHRRSNELFF
jgi:hypothetical protein